jgi:hypothetical protein
MVAATQPEWHAQGITDVRSCRRVDWRGGRGGMVPLPPGSRVAGGAQAGQGLELRMLRKSLKRKVGPRVVVLLANWG